jgi:phosphatidylinositol kinase/protein kinase (PI-3  family)
LGEAPHHDHLEHFELWIWNCKHVTDAGLEHLFHGLSECKRLHTLKLYMGETGLSQHHSSELIKKFLKKRKHIKNVRIATDHMDIGCPKKFHGILG